MRAQHLVSIVLIIAVAVLLVLVAGKYTWQADWTYANRNSLTEPSRRLLAALPGEIAFSAYAYPGPMRQTIRAQIDRYRRADADVTLTFIDPATHPQQMRALGVARAGEVRVAYQGRTETLPGLTEQQITNSLQRLSVGGEQWVVFLTGHGERDPQQTDPGGYSELRAELERQGLQVRSLNLAKSPRIPAHTAVLVIASPQQALLPGEVQLIGQYLAGGGNLLWLGDPSNGLRIQALADTLGVAWQGGTVIYPDYQQLGTGHPAMALVVAYPRHPITNHLTMLTIFPFAGGLEATGRGGWKAAEIVTTPARSWLETGALDAGEISYQKDSGDILGPITLGLALTRPVPPQAGDAAPAQAPQAADAHIPERQRAVVVSDSDFLTNANLNSLGNRTLGAAVFQWLARRDDQIAITVPPAPDSFLHLAPWQGRGIWYGFVLLLPAGLLAIGVGRWWLRRRR